MADLQTVFFRIGGEFGAAEQCGDVHLVQCGRDLGRIDGVGLLDCVLQDQPRRIPAGGVITRIDPVFRVEGFGKLLRSGPEVGLELDLRLPLRRHRNIGRGIGLLQRDVNS